MPQFLSNPGCCRTMKIPEFNVGRQADRLKMANLLVGLCEKHGLRGEVAHPVFGKGRSLAVRILCRHGLTGSVDLRSPARRFPASFIVHWYFGPEDSEGWIIAPDFAQVRNSCHFRKATDICHSFPELVATLEKRLESAANDKALLPHDGRD